MPRVPKLLWKIPVAILAMILGTFGASQAGWSGADVVLNFREAGLVNDFFTSLFFFLGIAICYAAIRIIRWAVRPLSFLAIPLFLYIAIVPSAWNGYVSGFDHSRAAVMKDGWANAFVIQHMTPRGRYETCSDSRIRLTEDAEPLCSKVVVGGPGEVISGSGHRCGLLALVTCYDVAPSK